MTTDNTTPRRQRRPRMRSSRRLRLGMLCIASVALFFGVLFCIGGATKGNERFGVIGIVYVLCALVIFGIRAVIGYLDQVRKRNYRS